VFEWDRVALVLITIFVVVLLAEIVATQLRKRVI
jgi:phosphonate transport system permease protein